eukprot:GSA120T00024224001.1
MALLMQAFQELTIEQEIRMERLDLFSTAFFLALNSEKLQSQELPVPLLEDYRMQIRRLEQSRGAGGRNVTQSVSTGVLAASGTTRTSRALSTRPQAGDPRPQVNKYRNHEAYIRSFKTRAGEAPHPPPSELFQNETERIIYQRVTRFSPLARTRDQIFADRQQPKPVRDAHDAEAKWVTAVYDRHDNGHDGPGLADREFGKNMFERILRPQEQQENKVVYDQETPAARAHDEKLHRDERTTRPPASATPLIPFDDSDYHSHKLVGGLMPGFHRAFPGLRLKPKFHYFRHHVKQEFFARIVTGQVGRSTVDLRAQPQFLNLRRFETRWKRVLYVLDNFVVFQRTSSTGGAGEEVVHQEEQNVDIGTSKSPAAATSAPRSSTSRTISTRLHQTSAGTKSDMNTKMALVFIEQVLSSTWPLFGWI